MSATTTEKNKAQRHPPRDGLVRAVLPGMELREDPDGDGNTLFGHFARFNQWTEIDSIFEGRFMERVAPGAFKKTFRENRAGMRVLFQHGRDQQIGSKPLGPIEELKEDKEGAYYEARLMDTSYNADLLPGLRAGVYGASFRFRVMKEEIVDKPRASDDNPDRLPERTIKEAQVQEFGPVTFPAYATATAGVRSMTDDFLVALYRDNGEALRELIEQTHGATSVWLGERSSRSDDEEDKLDAEDESGESDDDGNDASGEGSESKSEGQDGDGDDGDGGSEEGDAGGDGDDGDQGGESAGDGDDGRNKDNAGSEAGSETHSARGGHDEPEEEPLFGVPSRGRPDWLL